MEASRRLFVVSGSLFAAARLAGEDKEAPRPEEPVIRLAVIGRVEAKEGQPPAVRIFDEFAEGLLGLDQWSHVHVLCWLDKSDTPERRKTLRVHPRGNRDNPLTGVFACRAPFRPNPLSLSVCRIAGLDGPRVRLDALDVFDGTPVLDLKPFNPSDAPAQDVRVPGWASRGAPPR
jgi:tRNA-Thr(GGU) m(6)t(6)A37 methyltransferase TsaA